MYDNYIIDDYFFGCLNSLFILLLPTLSLLYISLSICHTHKYTHPNTLTHTRTHALLILYLTSYENVIHNNINQQIHMIVIPPPVLIPFLNQKFTFLHPDTLFSPSTSISPSILMLSSFDLCYDPFDPDLVVTYLQHIKLPSMWVFSPLDGVCLFPICRLGPKEKCKYTSKGWWFFHYQHLAWAHSSHFQQNVPFCLYLSLLSFLFLTK